MLFKQSKFKKQEFKIYWGQNFCPHSKIFVLIMEVVSLIQRVCLEGSTVKVTAGSILFVCQHSLLTNSWNILMS